ncbi:unnamed protein product [Brachionus calyciflorus]|uniref:Uncharacterized protein n=1 Tax=Brachionus calyciflorus TaxID=104777 RepID=A0A814P6U4_9BILA|nr:unnamed protein product [Brachionus calyciflorus]
MIDINHDKSVDEINFQRSLCSTSGDKIGEKYRVTLDEALKHCHASDPVKLENLEKRRLQKQKATFSDEPTRKLISEYVAELKSDEAIVNSLTDDAD